MGKLKILSGKEVCKVLSKHNFVEVRRRGSHIIMQMKNSDSTITVPILNHPEIKIGTLLAIIRQSGLSRSFFETD